jgi:CRISPR-associated endonuclease/helicase Cas3
MEQGKNRRLALVLSPDLQDAQVALLLWQEAVSPAAQQHVAAALGLGEKDAGRFVAFVAALHDLGKASPG